MLWSWIDGGLGWLQMRDMSLDGLMPGMMEVFSKLLALLSMATIRNSTNDGKSGLFYAALCAVGFALIENVQYFFMYGKTLWIRILPTHMIFSALWGYALGCWLAGYGSLRAVIGWLMVAMALHELWNNAWI